MTTPESNLSSVSVSVSWFCRILVTKLSKHLGYLIASIIVDIVNTLYWCVVLVRVRFNLFLLITDHKINLAECSKTDQSFS